MRRDDEIEGEMTMKSKRTDEQEPLSQFEAKEEFWAAVRFYVSLVLSLLTLGLLLVVVGLLLSLRRERNRPQPVLPLPPPVEARIESTSRRFLCGGCRGGPVLPGTRPDRFYCYAGLIRHQAILAPSGDSVARLCVVAGQKPRSATIGAPCLYPRPEIYPAAWGDGSGEVR